MQLFLFLPTAAALCGQTVLAITTVPLFYYRGVILAVGIGLILWSLRLKKGRYPALPMRFAGAWAASMLIWLTGLEVWLAISHLLLARDLLLLSAAACIYATVLSFAMKSAARKSNTGRFLMLMELLLCSGILAVFIVEFLIRILIPLNLYEIVSDGPIEGPCLYNDEDGRILAKPGFRGHYLHPEFMGLPVEINDWGLRDGLDEAVPVRPGEASILMLGDSFTFGTGVYPEETYQELLEKRSGEIVSAPLRVFGAGMPGYGPFRALQMLDVLKDRVQPDVVVLAFYEGNDFVENMQARAIHAGRTRPPRKDKKLLKLSPALKTIHEMDLFMFLKAITRPPYWCGSSATVQWFLPRVESTLAHWGIIDRFAPSNAFLVEYMQKKTTDLVRRTREEAVLQLLDFRKACNQLGAELLLLLIPASIQVDPIRFEAFLATRSPEEAQRFDRTHSHYFFVRVLKDNDFNLVDPFPLLEAEALAGRSGYRREGHWNVQGHAIAANLLAPKLAEIFAGR